MRNQQFYILALSICILLFASSSAMSQSQNTLRVNYQGQLIQNGSVINDTCDVNFLVFDSQADGTQLGTIHEENDLSVNNGLFNTTLNFGEVASPQELWVEIALRCGADRGTLSYTPLSPRQELLLGPAGPQGVTGPRAERGPVGATGPAGVAGARGERGPAGAAGSNGASGPAGPAGTDGKTGIGLTLNGENSFAVDGDLSISGALIVSGTKSSVATIQGKERVFYAEEATEVWFTDYGFGTLNGTSAVIQIDSLFAQSVNLSKPYHVFIQPYADTDMYVGKRTPTSFTVFWRAGTQNADFSFRIVAKRLGYEDHRMEEVGNVQ